MELIRPGLIGMGASALACGVVLVVSALLAGPAAGRRALPVGLGIGYALGHAGSVEWLTARAWPPFPPLNATDWLPWLVLAAALLGVLESAWPSPAWARWENRALLTAATLGLLLGPLFGSLWEAEPRQGVAWLVGLGVGMLALWGALEALAVPRGRGMLLPLAVLAGGTAAVLVLSRFLVLGECALGLAAALAVAWVVSRWSPALSPAGGGVPVVAVVLVGLILGGLFYAEMPKPSALLLALAPLAVLADRVGPARRWPPWGVGLLRGVAVLVPVVAAVAFAVLASPPAPEEY